MSWVWGIDTGAKRLGLGIVELETGAFTTNASVWRMERETIPLPRSLQRCRAKVLHFMAAVAVHYPPSDVVAERATGRTPNPSLMFHGGVILEAVTEAVDLAPHLIAVGSWKRAVFGEGRGNEPKASLRPWAAGLGYPILDEDQIAGVAIAAGRARELGLDLDLLHPLASPVEEAA